MMWLCNSMRQWRKTIDDPIQLRDEMRAQKFSHQSNLLMIDSELVASWLVQQSQVGSAKRPTIALKYLVRNDCNRSSWPTA